MWRRLLDSWAKLWRWDDRLRHHLRVSYWHRGLNNWLGWRSDRLWALLLASSTITKSGPCVGPLIIVFIIMFIVGHLSS